MPSELYMTKAEVLALFIEVGMSEPNSKTNFTKKFGKKKEILVETIYLEYKSSKSKYKTSIMEKLEERFPKVEEYARELYQEQTELRKILEGVESIKDPDVPDVQVLERYLGNNTSKSKKQVKYIAKRACNEDGSIKKTSKYYSLFL